MSVLRCGECVSACQSAAGEGTWNENEGESFKRCCKEKRYRGRGRVCRKKRIVSIPRG